ncbi:MAG: 2-oxoacid:ferredoxin oxidoreductase subunit beta, partial [Bacteroidales bacterium]|nr:2-oxoacid:ferredoxin oxidoreductase subunit beta [Bacteroidales bacterium]
LALKVVTIGENGITEDDILTHDAECEDSTLHYMLVRMSRPLFPLALGVIRNFQGTCYDQLLQSQVEQAKENTSIKNMTQLLNSGTVIEN